MEVYTFDQIKLQQNVLKNEILHVCLYLYNSVKFKYLKIKNRKSKH